MAYFNDYLIGATKNHELVFASFGTRQRNDETFEFSASFDTVMPFRKDAIDLTACYEPIVDEMDKDWIWDKCDEYDCKPSEPAQTMADYCDDITEIVDCSLYPECYNVDGDDWYFESMCCGQHDTRDEIEETTCADAYNKLHELWDKYHLKAVDVSIVMQANELADAFAKVDEEEWITDYIKRHIDEL